SHPGEAREPAASGRVKQDGLGLVVARVTGGDAGRAHLERGASEEGVPELARVVLARRRDRSAADPDGRAVPLREVRHELRVLRRCARPQAMVEVRDVEIEAQLWGEVVEEEEQRRRIRAAGHGDDERPGREEVVRTHEREDGGADRSSGRQRWLGWDSDPRPMAYESTALPLSYPAREVKCTGADGPFPRRDQHGTRPRSSQV